LAPLYQQPSPLPSDHAPSGSGRVPRRVVVAALLLGLLTVALFAPTWKDQMLYWDDNENVLDNPLVVMPPAAGLARIFSAPFSTDYYPLTYISLAIDHAVWHGHFFGYHVTQTLLHGANVFLVVLLVWGWTETLGVALLAGAWFGWHPVQVETVAWIAERKNVLGTLLFLLAWLAYLNADDSRRGTRWRLAALGLFLLAALTHALVIVMPALLIAYELFRAGGVRGGPARARPRAIGPTCPTISQCHRRNSHNDQGCGRLPQHPVLANATEQSLHRYGR
jgi:hypothetical protein